MQLVEATDANHTGKGMQQQATTLQKGMRELRLQISQVGVMLLESGTSYKGNMSNPMGNIRALLKDTFHRLGSKRVEQYRKLVEAIASRREAQARANRAEEAMQTLVKNLANLQDKGP